MSFKIIFAIYLGFYLPHSLAASHHPQEFLHSIEGTKDEGAQVVSHFCANCHAEKPLIPLGAPRMKIHSDWSPRIKQGLAELFSHTENGFNAMPPRGGCFECSDKQLHLAILAMLPEALISKVLDHK
ncbi:MAG: cytochrome c5 family protein [Tatlockia sp.]|nr:cytochrome c5 family protein [Tatlockia sp.]